MTQVDDGWDVSWMTISHQIYMLLNVMLMPVIYLELC